MHNTALGGLALLLVGLASGPAAAYEQVRIPGDEVALSGVLFRPKGVGPFPAVVGMHGCSGIGNRRNPLDPRFLDWGERLAAAGFVVLFPDSFGSRGEGPQCRVREREIRPRVERVADANAARRWLQAQAWVRPDRVFLMGWSQGGSTTVWGVRPQAAPKDGPDFRAAVAFYPGCREPLERGWSTRIPILVLIGGADNWTPPEPCRQMIGAVKGRAAEIVVYPNAYHSFDHPDQPVRELKGLAYARGGRAFAGTDPAARADELRRVPAWLRQ